MHEVKKLIFIQQQHNIVAAGEMTYRSARNGMYTEYILYYETKITATTIENA